MLKKLSFFIVVFMLIFIFTNVSFAAFSSSDLSGSWYGYMTGIIQDDGEVFTFYAHFNVNSSGTITSGTAYYSDGSTEPILGGTISLSNAGVLSGSINVNGYITTVNHGQINPDKSIIGVVAAVPSYNGLDVGVLIKQQGSFSTSDLAGTWFGYLTLIDEDTGEVYWFYTRINVDSSGNVTNGNSYYPDGSTEPILGGTISLNNAGVLSGFLNANGHIITINHGQIDPTKSIVGSVASGSLDVGILIKSNPSGGGGGDGGGGGGCFINALKDRSSFETLPSAPAKKDAVFGLFVLLSSGIFLIMVAQPWHCFKKNMLLKVKNHPNSSPSRAKSALGRLRGWLFL